MKLKRLTASLLTLIMLLSSVCVCFAADSNYDKIKNYVDKIAPSGEITISDLSNTLKVGTSSSDLKAEDISVRRNTDLTYSSSLDMSDVRTKYETIMTAINLLDTELKDIVNNSDVSGEFVIDITYDEKLDISAITENNFTELNNEIFDAENISVTYPAKGSMKIQVKISADKKVSNVSADKLSDITYRVSNVKTTENGGPYAVKVSMNGYVAFNADNKEYARIKFTSPETVRNVTVYTQSSGGRRPSNTNKTIKFDSDGGSNIPNQTITSGSNASVPAAPTKEGFTFEGWYTDAELTKTSVYKGYKRDKIEMRGDRAEISDFPLYLNTVAGGLDCRDQTIGGFSFVVKIYAVPVVEIIG